MSSQLHVVRRLVSFLVMGLLLTAVSSLFSRYEQGSPYHFLHNGLPLSTFTQVVDPVAGSLVTVQLDPLGMLVDVLFFSALWFVIKRSIGKLKKNSAGA